MTAIRIDIPNVQPLPKQRPRLANGHAFTPERTRQYESMIAWYASLAHCADPLKGDLFVQCQFYRKGKRRADVDNMLKAVLDACNGILWTDDKQIVAISAMVQYGSKLPAVVIEVRKIA